MKKDYLLYVLTAFFLVAVVACSTTPAKENKKSKTPVKVSQYRKLARQNLVLRNQNKELFKRIENIERLRKNDTEKYEKRLSNLDRTIHLMELSLNQMNNKKTKSSKKSKKRINSKKTEPKKKSTKQKTLTSNSKKGIVKDVITPGSSKAIESISLLPNHSGVDLKKKKTGEENVKAKKTNAEIVSTIPDNKKTEKKTNSGWEDPDLKSPVSPIKLRVIVGAKKAYQSAFKLYSNRNFSESIKKFNDFIHRFPNDLDTDNSQYWLGQSYYHLNDIFNAERSFRKILRNYEHKETKHGYKTPDAVLMLGRIYLKRNRPIKGRYYFQKVIELFPDSLSSSKAKIEIQSLSSF